MATSYPVHPDYEKVPSINIRFNRFTMFLLNSVLRFTRWRARKNLSPDVDRQTIRQSTAAGGHFDIISVRPKDLPQTEAAPAVVYYHGGAFAMTWSSMHLEFCERYALDTRCQVFLVAYRLMPEHPFPAGFDDCYQALTWVQDNADSLGVDPAKVAVMGDSAGGAMSAAVAQKALDNQRSLAAQVLIYPVLDHRCETASVVEFSDAPLWNGVSTRRMWDCYLKNSGGELPPYAAPGLREDLSGLPPTYVETAEFDPLRDEGLNYAQALQAQGIAVELNETKGTIHGYEMAADNPATVASLEKRIAFLKQAFST